MEMRRRSTVPSVALLCLGVGAGLLAASGASAQSAPVSCPTGQVAAANGTCTSKSSTSGGGTGKSSSGPAVGKETGGASPQVLSSTTTNETLKPAPGGTGQATHGPTKLTKETGGSSPQLFSSTTTNESLKTVPTGGTPKPKPCTNSKVPTAQAQCPPPKPKKG